MKKLIMAGLIGCMVMGSSFAVGITQLELAELLISKAKAENLVEQKGYSKEEVLTLVDTYDLMDVTDALAEVDVSDVRKILAEYDVKKLSIEPLENKTIVNPAEEKNVVNVMLENVLASKMVSPISISMLQTFVDQEETIYCYPGCYMEDGVIKVNDPANMESALEDIIAVGQVLQPHAKESGLMASFTGGGAGMFVAFGENAQQLNEQMYMFEMGYLRYDFWANEEEIDGKTYEFEKEVTIGGGLFASKRMEREYPISQERRAHRREYIDMDEDVLNAFYDGLRVLDEDRSEALFEKMTSDYIYAKTHQYGDPNDSLTEFFEIDGQLIHREDVRDDVGRYRHIIYRFVK